MINIESVKLPLYRTVDTKSIAQPIVGGASEKHMETSSTKHKHTYTYIYFIWNSFVQNECVMFSMESHRQWA